MLLNGGELDGVRLLSPKTVKLMTPDHVGQLNAGFGFGLGFSVRRNLREVDTVARFGGEEFVLLLPDTDKRGAIAVAEKVRLLVEGHSFVTEERKETKSITISAGVATYPDDVEEMDNLIDHADIALYRAKERGRNRIECFKELEDEGKEGAPEELVAEEIREEDKPKILQ